MAFFKARGVISKLIGVFLPDRLTAQRHVYLLSSVAFSVLSAIRQADSVQNVITRSGLGCGKIRKKMEEIEFECMSASRSSKSASFWPAQRDCQLVTEFERTSFHVGWSCRSTILSCKSFHDIFVQFPSSPQSQCGFVFAVSVWLQACFQSNFDLRGVSKFVLGDSMLATCGVLLCLFVWLVVFQKKRGLVSFIFL